MPQTNLTPAVLRVLVAASRGLTVDATAAEIGRSAETVRTHRKRVLSAFGAANMTQAVAVAYERGVLGTSNIPREQPISPGKRDAFHAKCSALDKAAELPHGTSKRDALERASSYFGREIESVNDLTSSEASRILDELEVELAST